MVRALGSAMLALVAVGLLAGLGLPAIPANGRIDQFIVPRPGTPPPASAPCTTTTANATVSTIQSAINAAASGDVVCVPSTGGTSWGSAISISGKALTLRGATTCTGAGATLACTDNTNITCAVQCLSVSSSATNFVAVTGFSFTVSGGDPNNGALLIDGSDFQVTFRLHHTHFVFNGCTPTCVGAIVNYANYGLYDHMLITTTAHVWGLQGDWGDAGFGSWKRAMDWGGNSAIYIEDSKITVNGATDGLMDGFAGGRFVFRYNAVTVTGSSSGSDILGTHGTDSGNKLSWLKSEVYENSFTNNGAGTNTFFRMRGGSGVFFNNTFGGSQGWSGIILQTFRANASCNSGLSFPACDGTQYKATPSGGPPSNSWSFSTGGTYKFCATNRSTYCTADATCDALTPGDTCSSWVDGNGTAGYACRGQPGRGSNETLEPVYAWNNGSIGVSANCNDGSQMQLNRDYYDGTAKPGYTAYTYPHPLQSGN